MNTEESTLNNSALKELNKPDLRSSLYLQNGSTYRYYGHGTHGFDNQLLKMKPIFYAKGPRIRKGFEVEPFNSVDIYPFISSLLGIQPSPNNGTLDIVRRMVDDTIAVIGK